MSADSVSSEILGLLWSAVGHGVRTAAVGRVHAWSALNTCSSTDSAITDMRGDQDDGGQIIVAVVARASPTYFLKTVFSAIQTAPSSPIIVADGGAPIKIQECTFSNSNTATNELRAFGTSEFFVDNNDEVTVVTDDGNPIAPQPLSAARGNNFLTDADEWSVNIRKVRSHVFCCAAPWPPVPAPPAPPWHQLIPSVPVVAGACSSVAAVSPECSVQTDSFDASSYLSRHTW